jgi:hypothetical protein
MCVGAAQMGLGAWGWCGIHARLGLRLARAASVLVTGQGGASWADAATGRGAALHRCGRSVWCARRMLEGRWCQCCGPVSASSLRRLLLDFGPSCGSGCLGVPRGSSVIGMAVVVLWIARCGRLLHVVLLHWVGMLGQVLHVLVCIRCYSSMRLIWFQLLGLISLGPHAGGLHSTCSGWRVEGEGRRAVSCRCFGCRALWQFGCWGIWGGIGLMLSVSRRNLVGLVGLRLDALWLTWCVRRFRRGHFAGSAALRPGALVPWLVW